ncbi:MAG TPA: CHAD domain-containing protein [Anaerolineales bacterium]|nr:CHAD domain-containing protein [Anaerolineales bacterium]
MDAKDLLLDLLDRRGATYGEKLKGCRDDFSKDAVHDLRTSLRRLLAALQVVAFFTSRSRAQKLSDRLEEQLDDFSDLRDLQVLLDKVSENINTLPELEPFQDYLEKHEKRKQRAGEKHVKNFKLGGINKRLLKIRQAVEDLSAQELDDKLPQAVDEAYLTVMQRYGEIDPAQLVTIHHLRVAFKKFRYMVETIYPCLPGFPDAQLKRMHDYQTQMGDIHDLQVLLETLAQFAEGNDSYDPRSVRRFYEQVLAKLLSAYVKNKEEVTTFWRATPLTAFPWEAFQTQKE